MRGCANFCANCAEHVSEHGENYECPDVEPIDPSDLDKFGSWKCAVHTNKRVPWCCGDDPS